MLIRNVKESFNSITVFETLEVICSNYKKISDKIQKIIDKDLKIYEVKNY